MLETGSESSLTQTAPSGVTDPDLTGGGGLPGSRALRPGLRLPEHSAALLCQLPNKVRG